MVDVRHFYVVDQKSVFYRATAAHDQAVALIIDFRHARQAHENPADVAR